MLNNCEAPSSTENRGDRLKYLREQILNLSRPEFCDQTDINVQSLKGWELAWGGGLSEKGSKKIITRCESLGIYCSAAWLMHGIGPKPMRFSSDWDIHEEEERQIASELLAFREQGNTLDTVILDDALFPSVRPGDYVAGVKVDDFASTIDKPCILVTCDDEVYVRVVKAGSSKLKYDLACSNTSPAIAKPLIKDIVLKAVAPILWIRHKKRD